MNIEKLAIEHGKASNTVMRYNEMSQQMLLDGYNFTKSELEAFAKALQQSSEPVASVIYEVYVGLDNWREVPKAEYDDYKRTKRTLVTANTTDFCYAELKDIYDEMYQHKDIARVANRLYKLIHSRTHPPASVPLEKYNKLLEQRNDAIKALGDLSFECFAGIGLTQPSVKTYNETFKTLDRLRKAIAEAEGKEG